MIALFLLLSCEEPTDERMWRYVNEDGRTVYVNDRDRIPERFRAAATPMESEPTSTDTQTIYRYQSAEGRTVFVNGIDLVPPDRRDEAEPVDLSKVSTNQELGHDLDTALESEWARLVESHTCKEARAEADAGFAGALWHENGHLVVIGAAILVLLFLTPTMIRRFDAPTWSRVLVVSIPSLAFLALFAHAFVSTRAHLRRVHEVSEPCDPTALSRVPDGPEAVAARLGLLEQLRKAVLAADIDSGTRTTVRPGR